MKSADSAAAGLPDIQSDLLVFRPVAGKAFLFFLFIAGMQGLLTKLVGFFIPLYFDELGFSGVQTGIYFSFASVATIILSLPMGVSTDQKPIAGIFMLSFLLVAVSYIGFLFFKSFLVFCLFAFFQSFGNRFFMTGREALFFKITDRESPAKAAQFNLFTLTFTGSG